MLKRFQCVLLIGGAGAAAWMGGCNLPPQGEVDRSFLAEPKADDERGSARPSSMSDEPPTTVIAFGSCAKESRPQPIWHQIARAEPDAFLFIGDNIYADTEDIGVMRAKYAKLAAKPAFAAFRERCPIFATWDDHDYGENDAGKEYPMRAESQTEFLDFFGEPERSSRRLTPGVYDSEMLTMHGKRVQIILLDTRYFRDAITRDPAGRKNGLGPYIPNTDTSTTMLGEDQWVWLMAQLRREADVRIIASSIQVVPFESRWETWGNMPHERQRLYDLIGETGAEGVVFVSGDRHLCELSRDDSGPYPMLDLTSSGMTERGVKRVTEPNRFRLGDAAKQTNYGLVRIEWSEDPVIELEARDAEGALLLGGRVLLSTLAP